MQRAEYIETSNGVLRGARFREVTSFLGVPYGASTAGANRFRPPKPVEPWLGVRDARAYGDSAPQLDVRADAVGLKSELLTLMYPRTGSPLEGGSMSEDCLVLNVWTPEPGGSRARPVMVWLHGGGFDHGSSAEPMCSGDELARIGDVVVVSLNHRLGLLGFLPLDAASENFEHSSVAGMLDIVQALEWVRDHIRLFGGDPGNVTIFGQSGGGAKVNALLAMPSARGLFHKAINQSGALTGRSSMPDPVGALNAVLATANLPCPEAHRLAELSLDEILKIQHALTPRSTGGLFSLDGDLPEQSTPRVRFAPGIDPAHTSDSLGVQEGIPLLIGFTSHEATAMLCDDPGFSDYTEDRLLRRFSILYGKTAQKKLHLLRARHFEESAGLLLARALSTFSFQAGAIEQAQRSSRQSTPVYMYEFGYQSSVLGGRFGAPHCAELPFVFGTAERSPFAGDRPERRELMGRMVSAWAAFAHHGSPEHPGIPAWPTYSETGRETMYIDTEWRLYSGADPGLET